MEFIILAGGLGTRLRSIIGGDIPKPMVNIGEKPFLWYVLRKIIQFKPEKIIMSVGYRWEVIKNYFGDSFEGVKLLYSVESKPLGTGGGILLSMKFTEEKDVFVINGDTFFDVNYSEIYDFHIKHNADITIVLKPMKNFSRYGNVLLNGHKIVKFEEKVFKNEGLINGGVYMINKKSFLRLAKDFKNRAFSFEKDFLEKFVNELNILGFVSDSYFIDIGIPEDYEKAKREFVA